MSEISAQRVRLPDLGYVYRCNECRALLIDEEDARAHLWWHDALAQVGRVRELHDRLVASPNDPRPLSRRTPPSRPRRRLAAPPRP